MSWMELEPITHTVGTPKMQAHVKMNKKHGEVKLGISFAEHFIKDFPYHEKCDVYFGSAEAAGKIKVLFRETGKHSMRVFAKGGAGLYLPAVPPIPGEACKSAPCVVETRTDIEVVAVLPFSAWNRKRVVLREPLRSAEPVVTINGKIDAVKYLKGKGYNIARLAGDYWQVNGERKGRSDVCGIVNKHRKDAEIPLIKSDEIF